MLVATSVCSILLAFIYGRSARRVTPAVLVPVFSVVSAALFLVEWYFKSRQPFRCWPCGRPHRSSRTR